MSQMIDTTKLIYKRADGSMACDTVNDEPSMTQQQFKDDCDINNIMRKYANTGEFTHLSKRPGVFADMTSVTDYQDMLHKVHAAQAAFSELPAATRVRFENDPANLIAFLQDDKNYDEAVKLGLCESRKYVNKEGLVMDDKKIIKNDDSKPADFQKPV